jgi:hypothetical protein
MSRTVTLAVDGGGTARYHFLRGTLKRIHFDVADNAPITIHKATSDRLEVGQCSQRWFTVEVDDAPGPTFLQVEVSTDSNASCNFNVPGAPDSHTNPGKTQTLTYNLVGGGGLSLTSH